MIASARASMPQETCDFGYHRKTFRFAFIIHLQRDVQIKRMNYSTKELSGKD